MGLLRPVLRTDGTLITEPIWIFQTVSRRGLLGNPISGIGGSRKLNGLAAMKRAGAVRPRPQCLLGYAVDLGFLIQLVKGLKGSLKVRLHSQ
jgi:hypothetical protein